MADSQANFLDVFPAWLRSLGDDAEKLALVSAETKLPEPPRQSLVGGLNYLFKSLDLVPDGIDDIGYLDDAFVLRVAADHALRDDLASLSAEQVRLVNRLSEDARTIQRFLGADFGRIDGYVAGLRKVSARGRSVQDILHNPDVRAAFLSDVKGFSKAYQAPGFAREDKNLVKLRAFFDAKLPK